MTFALIRAKPASVSWRWPLETPNTDMNPFNLLFIFQNLCALKESSQILRGSVYQNVLRDTMVIHLREPAKNAPQIVELVWMVIETTDVPVAILLGIWKVCILFIHNICMYIYITLDWIDVGILSCFGSLIVSEFSLVWRPTSGWDSAPSKPRSSFTWTFRIIWYISWLTGWFWLSDWPTF